MERQQLLRSRQHQTLHCGKYSKSLREVPFSDYSLFSAPPIGHRILMAGFGNRHPSFFQIHYLKGSNQMPFYISIQIGCRL